MSDVKIKPIEEKDMKEIYRLYGEFAAYEKLEDYFSLLHMLKAENEGQIAGFAAYYYQVVSFPAKKVLYLEDIYVQKMHRGKGIGNLFLKRLEEIARENDCLKMSWKCLGWNQSSRAFYEHIGAKLDEEWVTYEKKL